MPRDNSLSGNSDAELKARLAALKNAKAIEASKIAKSNNALVSQIKKLRGGSGLGGPIGGGGSRGPVIK